MRGTRGWCARGLARCTCTAFCDDLRTSKCRTRARAAGRIFHSPRRARKSAHSLSPSTAVFLLACDRPSFPWVQFFVLRTKLAFTRTKSCEKPLFFDSVDEPFTLCDTAIAFSLLLSSADGAHFGRAGPL